MVYTTGKDCAGTSCLKKKELWRVLLRENSTIYATETNALWAIQPIGLNLLLDDIGSLHSIAEIQTPNAIQRAASKLVSFDY